MNGNIPKNENLPSARVWRAMGRGIRNAYDNAGYVILFTFITFVITGVLLWFASNIIVRGPLFWLMIAIIAYINWIWATGVFYYANRTVYYHHPTISDTFYGIKKLFGYSTILFFADAIITIILAGDAAAFFKIGGGFTFLAWFFVYLTMVWLMMSMYHLPLLVAQLELESPPVPKTIIKKSFLLTVDNPFFTVILFLAIIAIAAICMVTAFIGMATIFLGVVAFILTDALRELFIRYSIVEDEPEVIEDRGNLDNNSYTKPKDGD